MMNPKFIFAVVVSLLTSFYGSIASARHEVPNKLSENDISERLNIAAENSEDGQSGISGYIFEKFAQWYNWSNWNNWQNWGNGW